MIQEIDAEDVGIMTLCGWLAAVDSAPFPNALSQLQLLHCNLSFVTFSMKLLQCNLGINQFQTQEIKQDLQVQVVKLILIPQARRLMMRM